MATLEQLPYLTTLTAVDPGEWQIELDGRPVRPSTILAGWDYASTLRATCEVTVDAARVRQECGLDDRAQFELVAFWSSTTTKVRKIGHRVQDPNGTVRLMVEISPGEAGGRLSLDRRLVLTQPSLRTKQFAAPERVGAILWREPKDLQEKFDVEGGETRFPMVAVQFSNRPGWPLNSLWLLQVDQEDLHRAATSCVRVYLNSEHPRHDELVQNPDGVLTAVLEWDIARQLIDRAIEESVLVEEEAGSFPNQSLGELMVSLVSRYFKGQTPSQVARLRASRRDEYEALLQASSVGSL
jgi:hypothetical protein